MIITDGNPKFMSVSGFVLFYNMIEVMNIHQSRAGITPLASAYIDKHPRTCGTGFYVAFNAQIKKKDLTKLNFLMEEMMVDGLPFKEETEE